MRRAWPILPAVLVLSTCGLFAQTAARKYADVRPIPDTPAGRRVGHSGGFTGISAGLDIYLEEGWNVAVLSNFGGVAPIITTRAANLIFQGR